MVCSEVSTTAEHRSTVERPVVRSAMLRAANVYYAPHTHAPSRACEDCSQESFSLLQRGGEETEPEDRLSESSERNQSCLYNASLMRDLAACWHIDVGGPLHCCDNIPAKDRYQPAKKCAEQAAGRHCSPEELSNSFSPPGASSATSSHVAICHRDQSLSTACWCSPPACDRPSVKLDRSLTTG